MFIIEADLNASFTYLHQAQQKLQNVVKLKFDEAVKSRNESQVARYELDFDVFLFCLGNFFRYYLITLMAFVIWSILQTEKNLG